MYKKFLIIASKQDKAGINITTQLSQFGSFNFSLVDKDILHEENLDLDRINNFDFILFASKHSSEKKEKTVSIHAPGNFSEANLGGKLNSLCKSSALFQKQLFENLSKQLKEHLLDDKYALTLEATHHGPFISKPCVFVEIGSTEFEWNDRKVSFAIAQALKETLENFQENPYREIAVGIGGPHYCPNFNKIQLNSNIALSHIVPGYALPLEGEILLQTIKQTEEEVDFVLLDWKGIGNSEQRQN
jgi:D-aminoacyl-tRNA deacylase